MEPKRVLIIEDHPLVAGAMRDLIVQLASSAVVRTCHSLGQALCFLREEQPCLVLVDICLADARGPCVLAAVCGAAPQATVAVWSGTEEVVPSMPETRTRWIPFVSKSLGRKEAERTVQALLRRCSLLDLCGDDSANGGRHDPLQSLSPKQREILRLLATGRSNGEIAEAMSVSAETIKTHLREIFGKLQVKNRTQAVLFYQSRRLGSALSTPCVLEN